MMMKYSNLKYLVMLFAMLMTASCDEDITLNLKNTDKIFLVVDGMITNETKSHCVRLTTSIDYYSTGKSPAVSGATVTLNDGISTITLTEDDATGKYYTPSDYQGVAGRTYHLSIDAVVNGEAGHYESESLLPEAGFRIDAIDYYYDSIYKGDTTWYISMYGLDYPEFISYYAFDISVNGVCYPYKKWQVMAGEKYVNGNYMNGGNVFVIDCSEDHDRIGGDKILETGDIITLYCYTVTNDFYNFLRSVSSETSDRMPIFSPQPSNVSCNISGGGALGFFSACNVQVKTLTVTDPWKKKADK